MGTVKLSDEPKSPHELEDYVAALFQSARYFVEKNIIERDFTEILELDTVATTYEESVPYWVLAEAKSGDWGFPDIFKVIGWMRYLEAKRGALFVSKEISGKDPASVQKKVAPLGVSFVHLGDFSDATDRFRAAGFPEISDPLRMVIWRYAYWIERRLIDKLRAIAKTDPSRRGPSVALEYHSLVNNGIFFVKDVRERLSDLYDAYKAHPRLSLGLAVEMGGGEFDPEAEDPKNVLIREAILYGRHDQLQGCFYVEHRARLAILKAAIDYVCLNEAGLLPTPLGGKIDFKELMFSILPHTFHEGLKELKGYPSFKRYALFWQVFLWGFGGFFLEDRKDMEFEWLAEHTGVPAEEIPIALKAFDLLFPIAEGWITQAGPSKCMIVKIVPAAFRGLGAFHRLRRYELKDYRDFGYTDYTKKDLVEWNNATYALLTK
jgi:hypothetical protein